MPSILRDAARTVVTFATMIPLTAAVCIALLAVAARRSDDPTLDRLMRFWARSWLAAAGAQTTVTGSELVDPNRSYVVVSNHSSNLDIMANFLAVPVPIRFLAKSELFRIPLFGQTLRSIGIVEIDRSAGTMIHEQINRSARESIDYGRSLMIYPEGTRSRDGSMRPFKKGAFIIAIAMDLPILPVAIRGSASVWGPDSPFVRSGPIEVEVLPAIETTDLTRADVDQVRAKVESVLATAVGSELGDGR